MIMNNKFFKVSVIAMGLAMFISGCATMPEEGELLKSNDELAAPLIESWKSSEPAIKYFKIDGALVIDEPNRVPAHIKNIDIQTKISPEAVLSDIGLLLDQLGIYAIIPEDEVRSKPVTLFAFKGKLGDYLDAIASAYDVSFNWKKGNVLAIESTSDFIVRIPQDEDLADQIKESLASLGADSVTYSLASGSISYKANHDDHGRIIEYMERLSLNAALVSIQASVVTVALDSNNNNGFDWSALSANFGPESVFDEKSNSNSRTTSNPNNSNIESGSGSESESESGVDDFLSSSLGSNLVDTKSLLALTSGSAGLSLLKGDLSFTTAINFLSTYGNTETKQSVLMKTLSGKEVGIKSINKVPYIDNVGVQSSQSGFTNGSGFGSSQVETLEVGLDLKLKPYYSADSELITIDVSLSLSSLLGFVELQAGNQLGTVSYPNTQEQQFSDIVKLRAGEPVIVGGITYDQVSDKRSNPSFLKNYETASKNETVTRNAMFILLRPTVTIFSNFDQEETVVFKE
jgi:type II secretory pathway component GspD/PulD (secretin)